MSNTPYDGPPQGNPFAAVSLVAGILALIGNGCCCIPLIQYMAVLVYPLTALMMIVAGVTGVMGYQRAKQNGEGMPLAIVGLCATGASLVLIAIELSIFGLGFVFVILSEAMN